MTVLYILVPLALLTASAAVAAFLWATRSGQLDDLETPAVRMLHDDLSPGAKLRRAREQSPPELTAPGGTAPSARIANRASRRAS